MVRNVTPKPAMGSHSCSFRLGRLSAIAFLLARVRGRRSHELLVSLTGLRGHHLTSWRGYGVAAGEGVELVLVVGFSRLTFRNEHHDHQQRQYAGADDHRDLGVEAAVEPDAANDRDGGDPHQ